MIEQLAMNLCLNAQEALGPGGGRLTLDARLVVLEGDTVRINPEAGSGSFVRLSVTDAGCGMTPAVLSVTLSPSFPRGGKRTRPSASRPPTASPSSTGAGWRSRPASGGSVRYRIHLPLLVPGRPADTESAKQEIPKGKETILVVDDEQAVRKMVALGLQIYGYHVLEANSGPEALQIWDQHAGRIDLLLPTCGCPDG